MHIIDRFLFLLGFGHTISILFSYDEPIHCNAFKSFKLVQKLEIFKLNKWENRDLFRHVGKIVVVKLVTCIVSAIFTVDLELLGVGVANGPNLER